MEKEKTSRRYADEFKQRTVEFYESSGMTYDAVAKDRDADPDILTNGEKALLANSLRPAHKLKDVLSELEIPRSSH